MKNIHLLTAIIIFSAASFGNLQAAPVADFNMVINCQDVTFTDASTGNIFSWAWDFGDGSLMEYAQNPIHAYANSGNYNITLIVGDSTGTLDTVTKALVIPSNPTPSISPVTSQICAGESTTLTASGGISYSWNTGSTNAVLTVSPSSTIVYSVTVTSVNGCTAAISTTVTVNAIPSAAISNPGSICPGETVSLTASGAGTGGDYSWSNGDTTPSISVSPASTTTFTVTVTNSTGCIASASRTVTVNQNPTASISPLTATITCLNESIPLTASGAGAGGSYSWSNGSTNATTIASPASTTNYSVTMTSSSGCTATALITVTVNLTSGPAVSIFPLGTINICAGQSVTLFASGGTSYQWSNAATTVSITVSPFSTTTYSVTVSDTSGCTALSRTVVVNPTPNAIISPATVTICSGQSVSLTASGGSSYSWSTGAQTASINVSPSTTTIYSVTVTNANGCTASSSRVVNVTPNLVATITPVSADICSGQSITLTASGGTGYLWIGGATTASITVNPTSTTTYTVTVIDANGCTASSSRVVSVGPTINTSISSFNSNCGNADGSATGVVTGGTSPFSYLWNTVPSQNTLTATNLSAGVYTIYVTDASGCTDSAVATISDVSAAVINSSVQSTSCQSASNGSVDVTVNGTAPFTFLWSTGDATEDLNGILPGIYNLTIIDSSGCIATHSATVSISQMALAVTSTDTSCASNDGTATVNINGGTSPYSFVWSNGQTMQTAVSLNIGWYSVTVTDSFGCQRHINVHVDFPDYCYVTISGTVYLDADSSCTKDSSENGIPNVMIDITPGGGVFTDAMGYYIFTLPVGTYTVGTVLNLSANAVCPSTPYNLTLNTGGMISDGNDFGLRQVPVQDLRGYLSCGNARPGFQQSISISVWNQGSLPASGYAVFALDSRLTYRGGSIPDSVSGNTFIYNFNNLPVNQIINFSIYGELPISMSIGTMLTHSVTVEPITGDATPLNNTQSCSRAVTNSYDPNDKAVIPEGDGPEGYIIQDDTLMYYTIRFQNTGNDTAYAVVIKDTLDSNLSYQTFQHGTASHDYTVHFEEDNVLVFTFENIMLPDSNVNERESHGHISYYLEHNGRLPFGSTISNRAAIYFDYNEPVITNTVMNTILLSVRVNEFYSAADNIKIYPNPAQDVLIIEGSNINIERITITDIFGKRMYDSGSLHISQQTLHIRNLAAGMYMIQIQTDSGQSLKKLIIGK